MEFIRSDTHIDFMSKRSLAVFVSAAMILISVVSLAVHGGPNYGIDFAGGTLVQIRFATPVTVAEIRTALNEAGLTGGLVQGFGAEGKGEYLIRLQSSSSDLEGLSTTVSQALSTRFGSETVEIRRTEMVGPKVGKDLRQKGINAIVFALVGILIYISWRFEFRFAVGAVLALAHDVIISVGALSLADKEFSLPVLAALLAIVGYSLNDTIVVYDRVRENMRRTRKQTFPLVVNASINETLSRTILTSGTTLIVVVILFIMGGGVIHDFTFTLLVGIIVGTYSSIFVASPIVILWQRWFQKKMGDRKK